MTVPEPITDDLFAEPDEELASAMDYPHDDLVAFAMQIYSIPHAEAEKRVLNQPIKTKAEISRFWNE